MAYSVNFQRTVQRQQQVAAMPGQQLPVFVRPGLAAGSGNPSAPVQHQGRSTVASTAALESLRNGVMSKIGELEAQVLALERCKADREEVAELSRELKGEISEVKAELAIALSSKDGLAAQRAASTYLAGGVQEFETPMKATASSSTAQATASSSTAQALPTPQASLSESVVYSSMNPANAGKLGPITLQGIGTVPDARSAARVLLSRTSCSVYTPGGPQMREPVQHGQQLSQQLTAAAEARRA
eukprot:TRINITY_DN6514_c0_g2_i2.p1 TRINITY_DN6514_c0_g2~~TRINITY_DN6514_c0_g2_i2.p1  ORF type:complete len:244 (-),score=66.26 TRINITY_DN6514_c0_g2_i2:164-895(-)